MKDYKKEKLKVAIYIRVANKETTREDSAIERQKHIVNSYLKTIKGVESKEYYIDNGYSGRNYNRPDFKRMVKDIKSKKVNTIIVKDLARFGRKMNAMDKINMLKKDYGANFIALDDKIDTINKAKEFDLRNLIFEMYRADYRERSRKAKEFARRNREFSNGKLVNE